MNDNTERSVLRMQPAGGASTAPDGLAAVRSGGIDWSSGVIEMRPMGVGQLVDEAVDRLRGRFVPCVALGMLLCLPTYLALASLLYMNLSPDLVGLIQMGPALMVIPAQVVLSGFVCHLIGGDLLGRSADLKRSLLVALRHAPGLLLVGILQGILAAVGVCACCVGTYLAQWITAVIAPCYVLEEGGIGDAISRGTRLVLGWHSLGRWLGWYAILQVSLMGLQAPAAAISNPQMFLMFPDAVSLPPLWGAALVAIGASLCMGIILAMTSTLQTVYYADLSVRRRGLDLRQELERLKSAARLGGDSL